LTSTTDDDHVLDAEPLMDYELIKLPIVNYIFYVYVESEKTPDDLGKCKAIVKKFVANEEKRIKEFKGAKKDYATYLFRETLPILVWYYRNGVRTMDEFTRLDKEKDFIEVISLANTLKANINKFNARVKLTDMF